MKPKILLIKKALLVPLFLLLIMAMSTIGKAQTVSIFTDQDDYSPGEVVVITGSGWIPGDQIQLTITHIGDFIPDHTHSPWTLIADADGNLYDEWPVYDMELNTTMWLQAQSLTFEEMYAEKTFTDSQVNSITFNENTFTITGSGFAPGAALKVCFINTTSLEETCVLDITSDGPPIKNLTGVTPFLPPGTYDVEVRNKNENTLDAALEDAFTVCTDVAITSVTAAESPICSGATTTLTASDVTGTNAVVNWYTQSGGQGTSLGTGLTFVAVPGTYYAYVTGDCGTAEASVTVEAIPDAALASVSGVDELCIDGTSTFTADGAVLGGGTGLWSSEDEDVATVDQTGKVTAVAAGACNILFTITGGCNTTEPLVKSKSLTVHPNAALASVSGVDELCIDGTSTFTADDAVLGGGTGLWSSNDEDVATVDQTGEVTAVAAGTCNIIYTITGGCNTAEPLVQSKALTVHPNAALASVSGVDELCIDGTSTFTADGAVLGGGTGLWSSSEPAVASVDQDGFVTALTAGSTNIIYTISGGCNTAEPLVKSKALTVHPNAALASVSGVDELCIDGTSTFTADDAELGGGTGLWTSDDEDVATVDQTGKVTAVAAGVCNIVYTITGGCNTAEPLVQSKALTVHPNAALTSVSGVDELCIDGTSTFTADDAELGGGTGLWTSSEPAVASVDQDGFVTALTAGSTNIIYTISGGCNTVEPLVQSKALTVHPNAALTSVSGVDELCIDGTSTFTADDAELGGGTGLWSSEDEDVATVDQTGEVTAVAAGVCNIVYTITGGCNTVEPLVQSKALTVHPNAALTSVSGVDELCIDGTSTFTADGAVLGGGTGLWSSSEPAVASVDQDGFVTALTAGSTNIIYTISGGCNTEDDLVQSKALEVRTNTEITKITIDGANIDYTEFNYGCTTPKLKVFATGYLAPDESYTYQWWVKDASAGTWDIITGATSDTYIVPPATAAGEWQYKVEVTGHCGPPASDFVTVNIKAQEASADLDAWSFYTGPTVAWTPTSTSNTATVTLSAFLKNSPLPWAECGDISTAKVTFMVGSPGNWTPIPSAKNLPVNFVDPANPSKGGTASAIVQLNIANNETFGIFIMKVVISGNYTANPAYGAVFQIYVGKLIPGGGIGGNATLCNDLSQGFIKGAPDHPAQATFGVEYVVKGKSATNPKGKVSLLVDSYYNMTGKDDSPNIHHYEITSNAIATLSVTKPTATFTAKSNIRCIDDELNPVAMEGNCTMVLDLGDYTSNGKPDKVGITVYRNSGGVWYSNNWVSIKTVPAIICGGDINVAGNLIPVALKSAEITTAIGELSVEPMLKVYPNPFTERLNIEFSSTTDAQARLEIYSITGSKLETLFNGPVKAGLLNKIEYLPRLVSSQMLFYHLILNGKTQKGKIMYNERK